MSASELWPSLLALSLLGVYHGLNPAMGWLFAVARGLQEKRRTALLQALIPIALGHEVSIGLIVALVAGLEPVTAPDLLRSAGALVLLLFGLAKLLKPHHMGWVGMRVTLPQLALWSFLMSSAHGAGLMLVPILLGLPVPVDADPGHDIELFGLGTSSLAVDGAAVLLHTVAMLLTMATVAVLVYEKLGLRLLRRAWVNVDVVWAASLVAAGSITLFT